jgi:acetolactate synthase-1/2/3 large subunit
MDAITLFKPITKWNWSIRNANNIPEIVRRAFKISLEEKSGATHIELPQNIAKEMSNILPVKRSPTTRSMPHPSLVKKAAKIILESKRPIILVGNGCIRENSSLHIRQFTEKTGICSMNTFMAKGVISDRSERHLQTIGIKQADHALIAMKNADVVIAIGYDLVEYSPKNWNGDLSKKIIHIDFTSAEVDTYYPPEVEIDADVEYTIDAILEELEKEKKADSSIDFPKKEIPELFKQIKQQVVNRIERHKNDKSFPIQPEKLVTDVRASLEDKDIVISDVGAHKMWISKTYNTFEPNTCLIPNGFCSMGFSVPGAIASQIVYPDRKVVALCGDGSFLMNVQEIETACRLNLPIIIIVWVDGGYGLISLKEMDEYGKDAFTRFNNPDFVKLAQSFGAIGYHAKSSEEFPKILEEAKKSKDRPVIIAIDVDYSRNKLLLHDDFEN